MENKYCSDIDSKNQLTSDNSEYISILNFSHPMTEKQKISVQSLIKKSVLEIIELPVFFDESKPLGSQIRELLENAGVSKQDLQCGMYIINLPGFSPGAAVTLAELHGIMGHFPTIIRMKKVDGSIPAIYDVEEIINLQDIRDEARRCRSV